MFEFGFVSLDNEEKTTNVFTVVHLQFAADGNLFNDLVVKLDQTPTDHFASVMPRRTNQLLVCGTLTSTIDVHLGHIIAPINDSIPSVLAVSKIMLLISEQAPETCGVLLDANY